MPTTRNETRSEEDSGSRNQEERCERPSPVILRVDCWNIMRIFRLPVSLISLLLVTPIGVPTATAQPAADPARVLFLGDRTCADNVGSCALAGVSFNHRYLHVVVHDLVGNDDWRVDAGPDCTNWLA